MTIRGSADGSGSFTEKGVYGGKRILITSRPGEPALLEQTFNVVRNKEAQRAELLRAVSPPLAPVPITGALSSLLVVLLLPSSLFLLLPPPSLSPRRLLPFYNLSPLPIAPFPPFWVPSLGLCNCLPLITRITDPHSGPHPLVPPPLWSPSLATLSCPPFLP